MRILGGITKILGIYDKPNSVSKLDKSSSVASKKDVVSISNQAKDYQTAIKAIRDVPDVRMDKISELSEKYEAGTYDVSGRDIADRIVNSVLDKRI